MLQLLPAIDLLEGRCVRLRQGNYEDSTVFSDDPVEMACRWQQEGAERLHLVDLDGARGPSGESGGSAADCGGDGFTVSAGWWDP